MGGVKMNKLKAKSLFLVMLSFLLVSCKKEKRYSKETWYSMFILNQKVGFVKKYFEMSKNKIKAFDYTYLDVVMGEERKKVSATSIIEADKDGTIEKIYFLMRTPDQKWEVKGKNKEEVDVKEFDLPDNRHQHILKDERIELEKPSSKKKYQGKLRRVSVWDEKNEQVIELITNQMTWTANTISELYKSRWQIEIFFREIKQLLHIKSFTGTSENAVMIQIWVAMISILILKFLKETAKYKWHLSNLIAFLRLNLFVKIDLQKWIDNPFEKDVGKPPPNIIQGVLF